MSPKIALHIPDEMNHSCLPFHQQRSTFIWLYWSWVFSEWGLDHETVRDCPTGWASVTLFIVFKRHMVFAVCVNSLYNFYIKTAWTWFGEIWKLIPRQKQECSHVDVSRYHLDISLAHLFRSRLARRLSDCSCQCLANILLRWRFNTTWWPAAHTTIPKARIQVTYFITHLDYFSQ